MRMIGPDSYFELTSLKETPEIILPHFQCVSVDARFPILRGTVDPVILLGMVEAFPQYDYIVSVKDRERSDLRIFLVPEGALDFRGEIPFFSTKKRQKFSIKTPQWPTEYHYCDEKKV